MGTELILKRLISESIKKVLGESHTNRYTVINEIDDSDGLTEDIESKIDEFGELSDEMDRLKNQLEELTNRYKTIEGELRPILEGLSEQNKKSLKTNTYLITIKRKGVIGKASYKYKEAFEASLSKVNAQTKKILEEVLDSTKSLTDIASSIGVQKIGENTLLTLWNKLVGKFRNLITPLIKKNTKDIDSLGNIAKDILSFTDIDDLKSM